MDWKSATTAKHKKEASLQGLTLLNAEYSNKSYRVYRFNDCGHTQEITLKVVRQGKFKCRVCFMDKLKKEAQERNVILLKQSKNGKYQYKFDKCGHEFEQTPSQVRRREPKCTQCTERKHKAEAEKVGLELIGKGKTTNSRMYKFISCGHYQEITLYNVRIDNFKCQTCHQDRLEQEAKNVGLSLVGDGKNASYRKYKCNQCSSIEEFTLHHVRQDSFECSSCLLIKLQKEAEKVGLKFIGAGKDYSSKLYRFIECGHTQEIGTDAVRKDHFLCNTCEITSRDKPSILYLLMLKKVDEDYQWLKLGYSKNIESRINQYGLAENILVTKIEFVNFETGREAHEKEVLLHKKYNKHRIPAEKMITYHTQDGFSECYPTEMFNILKEELLLLRY